MAYKDSLLITSLCDKTKVEENYVHTIVIIRFKKTKSSKKRFKKTKKQKRKGKPTGGSTVIYIYIYILLTMGRKCEESILPRNTTS